MTSGSLGYAIYTTRQRLSSGDAPFSYLDRPRTGAAMPSRYSEVDGDRSAFYVDRHVWHELAPREDEVVIRKPSDGAFYATPLETILRNLNRDTVTIRGTLTNYRCGMTARQAYERGFKMVLGSDVTSTDDPDMQEPELRALRKGFARVIKAAEIMRALE